MNDAFTNMEQYILDHFDEAIEKGYIKVYVQPVVRTITRQVCGLEALARWEDPEKGLLMPSQFISVLEKHRRIHELDACIIKKVCEGYGRALNRVFVPVSINLSRLDYELCDIFAVVESAVRANNMDRRNLCIEITESVLADNEALMHQYIDRFHEAGYQVWMDDFGSGYSSLNVLKDYQFDELKIDMRFLSDFHTRSKRILASIVHMAKQIDIQTLAEGVETEEQFEFLRNIGCEKIQGFLFGRPLPYKECQRYVEQRGLSWESPVERQYYDDLGRINVLSATPFLRASDKQPPATGREMNSISLALLELRGENVEMLYTNQAFDESAAAIDWSRALKKTEAHHTHHLDAIPMNRLSRRLASLLESTRLNGESKMNTVYNDEYYEIKAKRLAMYRDICGILMSITNLSQSAAMDNQRKLDEGLRSLYSVYEQVALLDLQTNSYTQLYTDSKEFRKSYPGNLRDQLFAIETKQIFPEDQHRFMNFTNIDTLEDRMMQSGGRSLSLHLRTRAAHGAYVWKCYLLVRIQEGSYYLLVRDASGEVREFQSVTDHKNAHETKLSAEILWENAANYSSIKFFWKDRDRRFAGASRSFLEYYGMSTPEEIIGKTDEDMGWHLHPDLYRNEELMVLNEGTISHEVMGTCLVHGENQSIRASKMPIYNHEGEIIGLMGLFSQPGEGATERVRGRQGREDELTGLLNTRSLSEDMYAYIDEYVLRHRDFVRINVSIDGFADINQRYGFDFGDRVLQETGKALLSCCGNVATVARITGCLYSVLVQPDSRHDLEELMARIRDIPVLVKKVDGIPISLYLSVGASWYSETLNKEDQYTQAEMRRMTEDIENIPVRQLFENTFSIFRMYEDLPLAYAVYKVIPVENAYDAIVLYVNRQFCQRVERSAETLVGQRVSQLFHMDGDQWYTLAVRAALDGETIHERVFYPFMNCDMNITASRIIGAGFCAFTYQVVDAFGKPNAGNTMSRSAE
ncbi:MAG: EAL domain-containing protein [Clostridia bacterium]|nr:EAL domain-containing protein [Clostridia bacterium]